MTTKPKKLGLYVHIPFCVKRCAYCDFYSQSDYSLQDRYVTALLTEAQKTAEQYPFALVDTVYIGGGTPSSLSVVSLKRLLGGLRSLFRIDVNAEITLEANPATLTEEKLDVLRAQGVNRLSIGLQSTHDSELKTLSRIHTYEEFVATYQLAKRYIPNISLDLMYGLPDQTFDSFMDSLKRAVELSPSHISFYALKIEEGTPFALIEDKLALPCDDAVADMYLAGCQYLEENGYHQYEISNFAQQGCCSRHNIRYWKREEYLGFGPSAHSFVSNRRYANCADIHAYLRALLSNTMPPVCDDCTLTETDILEEEIMLRLRLSEGLDLLYLEEKTGYAMGKIAADLIERYVALGFVYRKDHRIALTPRGFLVSNTIISDLLPD